MQIKTTRFHLTRARMGSITKQRSWWEQGRGTDHSRVLSMEIGTTIMETSSGELPRNLTIPHPGLDPKEPTSSCDGDAWIRMLLQALLTTVNLWKQPGCPSLDEQIKEMWCLWAQSQRTNSYCMWTNRRNRRRPCDRKWTSQKDKEHIFSHVQ